LSHGITFEEPTVGLLEVIQWSSPGGAAVPWWCLGSPESRYSVQATETYQDIN